MKRNFLKHRNKFEVVADQAVASGGAFLVSILMARWLGLELFGTFTVMMMFVVLVSNFNQAFISTPFMTLSVTNEKIKNYENGVHALQLFMLAIYLLVFIAFLFFADLFFSFSFNFYNALGFVFLGLSYLLYEYCRRFSFAKDQHREALYLDIGVMSVQISALAMLQLWQQLHLTSMLATLGFSYGLAIPVFFRKRVVCSRKSLIDTFLGHWHFSSWLIATSFVQWLSGNYVILVSATMLGVSSVAVIRIGQTLMGSLTALYQVFENYVPGRAAMRLKNSGERAMWRYLFSIVAKMGLVILASAAIIVVLTETIIEILYGSNYLEYVDVFRLFPLLAIFIFPVYILRIGVRTTARNIHVFIAYLLNVLFGFLSANFLIARFGLAGVVTALVFSQIIMISWYLVFIFKFSQKIVPNASYVSKNDYRREVSYVPLKADDHKHVNRSS